MQYYYAMYGVYSDFSICPNECLLKKKKILDHTLHSIVLLCLSFGTVPQSTFVFNFEAYRSVILEEVPLFGLSSVSS